MGFFTKLFGGKPRVIKIIKDLVDEATLLTNNMNSTEEFENFLVELGIKYEKRDSNSYTIIFHINDSKWQLTCFVKNPSIVIEPLQTSVNFEDEEFRIIYFVVKKNSINHYAYRGQSLNLTPTLQEITAVKILSELGFKDDNA